MIRIVESKGIGTGMTVEPETRLLSIRVTPKALLSMINRFMWLESSPDGVKRWMVVNGTRLSREQIDSWRQDADQFEWAKLLLEELAEAAANRRASAKQARADLALGINKGPKFGL